MTMFVMIQFVRKANLKKIVKPRLKSESVRREPWYDDPCNERFIVIMSFFLCLPVRIKGGVSARKKSSSPFDYGTSMA